MEFLKKRRAWLEPWRRTTCIQFYTEPLSRGPFRLTSDADVCRVDFVSWTERQMHDSPPRRNTKTQLTRPITHMKESYLFDTWTAWGCWLPGPFIVITWTVIKVYESTDNGLIHSSIRGEMIGNWLDSTIERRNTEIRNVRWVLLGMLGLVRCFISICPVDPPNKIFCVLQVRTLTRCKRTCLDKERNRSVWPT